MFHQRYNCSVTLTDLIIPAALCLFWGAYVSYGSLENEIAIYLRCFLSVEILRQISISIIGIPLAFVDVLLMSAEIFQQISMSIIGIPLCI